jgi:ligand-binding sensor domain-containing protein/signal transduction histidine kinase
MFFDVLRFRSVVLAVGLWAFALSACGQTAVAGVTHRFWSIEDGLPAQDIDAIAQTADGFLWLGTPHGLVRFDGYRFTDDGAVHAPVLHEYGVSCLLAARDGSLWIGSSGGGVVRLKGGTAETYGVNEGLHVLSIRALGEGQDGSLWAGTDHGIYRYMQGRFSRIAHVGDPSVMTIAPDRHGGLWFGGHRLIHYSDGSFTDVALPAQRNPRRISALAIDSDDTLWIGTPYGLLKRTRDGVISPVAAVRGNVRTLHVDRTGRLWIGTVGDGVLMRDHGGGFTDPSRTNPLPSRVVLTCASDWSGDVWVGTPSGLARFSDTGMELWRITNSKAADYGSVFVGPTGRAWFANGAVTRIANGKEQAFTFPEVGGLQIRAIYRDASGAQWVGTLGEGAYRFATDGKVARYSAELGTGFVRGFLGTSDGSVWVGTDSGVARWFRGVVVSYQNSSNAPHEQVLAMAEAPRNGLWVGTASGLFLLQDGRFVNSDVMRALGRHRVWALKSEADGTLWIGTETGLYIARDGRFAQVLLPHVGAVSAVLSIVRDRRGRMLIGQPTAVFRFADANVKEALENLPSWTPGSLPRLRPASEPQIFPVANETGAELYGGLPNTAQADGAGGVWYATHLGPLHISATAPLREGPPPPVIIDRVAVDGRAQANREAVTLQPSARNLEIEATPILLSSRLGLQLRRRLVGLESEWTEIAPGVASIYGRLPPGRYIFRVEASWPNSKVHSSAEVEIDQESSLYRRPWFAALCVALAILLVWLYHRFQLHQMKLRFKAVMTERNRVAREIHDTVLQGCIGVSSLLEAVASSQEQESSAAQDARPERWSQVLQYARAQIKETIREARNAIWELRNPEEHKPLSEMLREMVDRLANRESATLMFEEIGDVPRIRAMVQHELVMVVREAVLNAMAHANAAQIVVRVEGREKQILVRVSDDGSGFDASRVREEKAAHFGLASMDERMKRIGGVLKMDSNAGGGTDVLLMLPLTAEVVWPEDGRSQRE